MKKNNIMDEISNNILDYILENFLFTDDKSALGITESFIDNNVVDSTGVIELVSFVEEQYNIKVEDNEITRSNFDSIEKLANFVIKKQS